MSEADDGKLRLMVVDDETDNLDLLYRTFRREFDVFKADSALKALQLLDQQGEMGIIISDQRMPRMNGTEFLSLTAERFPDTIRILLTGYTDVEDLVGAINAGKVFKYITKPWNPDELKTTVKQAAETYRVLKQRTNELRRALRRESLFNTVTTAIRESLDYRSMLQTVVDAIGQTFVADRARLRPVETQHLPASTQTADSSNYRFLPDVFSYVNNAALVGKTEENNLPSLPPDADDDAIALQLLSDSGQIQLISANPCSPDTRLIVPLTYQQDCLAVLILYRQGNSTPWSVEEIQLISEVAEQAALAISQAKLYQRIQEQTEQMRAELAVARQIQNNLLRQSWPELETVKIQACCYPAREVGGDFFEVYVHPQGDIWIAVGDVSGKGVPAALFMASAISVLRRELSQELPPEPNTVMHNLNSSLSDNLVGSNCFITMVIARYTPSTQQLVYANAGHVYPLVWSPKLLAIQSSTMDNSTLDQPPAIEPQYLKVRGVPLGILPIWQASAGTLVLQSGDILLLTSDGITEATVTDNTSSGSASSMLQQTGLWQLIMREQKALNLDSLLASIQAHNPVQEDDQTILSLEVM